LQSTNVDAFTPWSFEIFVLGLDIILPKMSEDNFKVQEQLNRNLIIDPSTSRALLDIITTNVRTSDTADIGITARANFSINFLSNLLPP
jgi:hypothetical protein